MATTPTAQRAAQIRSDLKAFYGITMKQVSVRTRNYSMGSSLDIDIHDHTVDIREVRNVAGRHESVYRDERTGEILCGGNRHLFVAYSDRAVAAYAALHADGIARLIAAPQGTPVEVDGEAVFLLAGSDGYWLTLHGADWRSHQLDPQRLEPLHVARALLARRGR